MTKREKHLLAAGTVFQKCLNILNSRSKKYATEDSPFENFEASADEAGVTVSQGIMTRFGDKKSRLRQALKELRETGTVDEFADETLEDTLCDMINYLVILRIWIGTEAGEDYDTFLERGGYVSESNKQSKLPFAEPAEEKLPQENWFKKFITR